MSKKLIVGALTLALLSTAMARSVNGTKEERAGGAFSHNGNSQGGVITIGQWIFSGANFPWHFNPFSGFSPPGHAPANSVPPTRTTPTTPTTTMPTTPNTRMPTTTTNYFNLNFQVRPSSR